MEKNLVERDDYKDKEDWYRLAFLFENAKNDVLWEVSTRELVMQCDFFL